LGTLCLFTHYDSAGVQVIKQGFAFAQKFGAEYDVLATGFLAQLGGVAHRHGAFDDHDSIWGNGQHVLHHALNTFGVEVVGFYVIVSGCGDDDVICAGVGICLVQRGAQVQGFIGQIVL